MYAETLALATYLENAALSWMRLPDCSAQAALCAAFERREHESVETVSGRVHDVATSTAKLLRHDDTDERTEDAIWADDKESSRTGLLLMSIAFNETRFRGYVSDGRCNSKTWRESSEGASLVKLGTCDGGKAYSWWQVHPENGFWLTWDGSDIQPTRGDVHVTKESLLGNQELGMIAALHMMRRSIHLTQGLRWYTGEWSGEAPKAASRLRMAVSYERAHPFAPES